jgi:hypothetical protein
MQIMREIALHLLDIAENSVAAGARNITLWVCEDLAADRLRLRVSDDGKGMDAELMAGVVDPFVTSRTTRKVGLGIPLLKAAAEACDGCLLIRSQPGKGTDLEVEFQHSHIDRMPLGNLADTLLTLVVAYPQIHWRLDYSAQLDDCGEASFVFDDQPIKDTLSGVPLCEPEILAFLRNYIAEGIRSVQDQIPEAGFFGKLPER